MVEIVGKSTNDDPVPASIPPQEPVYQFQMASVPRTPPENPKVTEEPEHIVKGIRLTKFTATEGAVKFVKVVVSVAVQPLKSVTVTLYVPAKSPDKFCKIEPFDQIKLNG